MVDSTCVCGVGETPTPDIAQPWDAIPTITTQARVTCVVPSWPPCTVRCPVVYMRVWVGDVGAVGKKAVTGTRRGSEVVEPFLIIGQTESPKNRRGRVSEAMRHVLGLTGVARRGIFRPCLGVIAHPMYIFKVLWYFRLVGEVGR